MSWIKRNLFFVLGSLAALGFMVFAGVFLFSNWKLNTAATEELEAQYTELKRLNDQNPHPGDGKKVDNIKTAEDEQKKVQAFYRELGNYFQPVQSIPPGTNVTGEAFIAQLRRAVDQLGREATNSSVALPPQYYFTFEAQWHLIKFPAGSLEPLAAHLGEIKAICGILFRARVNALDGIRRERVSESDRAGVTDYLDQASTTNDLAMLTPYEVSFRCFSAELAAVLNGFASSPHGFVLRAVNVEPAPATALGIYDPLSGIAPSDYTPQYVPTPNFYTQPPVRFDRNAESSQRMAQRYGTGRGIPNYPNPQPTQQPRIVMPVQPAGGGAAGARSPGGLQTVIDEGPLRVTLRVEVVRLTAR